MIDYLERLFTLPAQSEAQGEQQPEIPGAKAEGEQVEILSPTLPAGEEPEFRSTKTVRDVEVPSGTAVRAVEEFLADFEGGQQRLTVRRPGQTREGEGLERRLRRDSRRYDSGFYWY